MSKFAVAYINWFDNDLSIEIVEANSWWEALFKHTCLVDQQDIYQDLIDANNFDIDEWKRISFDCDSMIDVVELTER